MEKFISIVIPNYNGSLTIGKCLDAVFSSRYNHYEVIVVDDCSEDNSIQIIQKYPCKLIRLDQRCGASKARNVGARESKGEVIFFIDADCLINPDTLGQINEIMLTKNLKVLGGTYTRIPYDERFFSIFQSIFINYFETKRREPDYIASHALAIDAKLFEEVGGFAEDSFIGKSAVEDVELSHRLKRSGHRLCIDPNVMVQHIFNFSFFKSICNAARKAMFWTMYSIKNKDLLADSGCASIELKINGFFCFLSLFLAVFGLIFWKPIFLIPIPVFFCINLFINYGIIKAFYETKGAIFAFVATLYYTTLFPVAAGIGAMVGTLKYLWDVKLLKRYK
jgi:glycosyltransferase involved in cell wall biosynthesis